MNTHPGRNLFTAAVENLSTGLCDGDEEDSAKVPAVHEIGKGFTIILL